MGKNARLSIGVAAILLTAANLLGRGVGFLREIIFAKEFGLSQNFDIYLVGAIIPLILNTSLLYFAQNFFIPHYHNASKLGEKAQRVFFNRSFIYFFISGVIIAVLLFFFKGVIIDQYLWNNPEEAKALAENVLAIFIISIPINFTVAILSSFLFSEFRYAYPAASQLFLNIAVISSVLFLSDEYGIYSIAIGFLAGYFLQLIFLLFIVIRDFNFNPFILKFSGKIGTGIKSSVVIIMFIEVVNQFHMLVDRYFVNFIAEGGISTLNYAGILFVTPITIVSGALSTALFPALSENFSVNRTETLKEQFNNAVGTIILLFVPLAAAYIFMGEGIIGIIYKRGVFSSGDVSLTANVLAIYAYSMVIYAVYAIVNKLIYSAGLFKYLFGISIIVVGTKILLNFLLAESMQQNGLALSSSVSYAAVGILGYLLVDKKLRLKSVVGTLKKLLMILLIAIVSILFAEVFTSFFKFNFMVTGIIKIFLFGGVYLFLCNELHIKEFVFLRDYFLSKLKWGKSD